MLLSVLLVAASATSRIDDLFLQLPDAALGLNAAERSAWLDPREHDVVVDRPNGYLFAASRAPVTITLRAPPRLRSIEAAVFVGKARTLLAVSRTDETPGLSSATLQVFDVDAGFVDVTDAVLPAFARPAGAITLPRRGVSISFAGSGRMPASFYPVVRIAFDGVGAFVVPKPGGSTGSRKGRITCPRQAETAAARDVAVRELPDGRAIAGCAHGGVVDVYVVEDHRFVNAFSLPEATLVEQSGTFVVTHPLVPGVAEEYTLRVDDPAVAADDCGQGRTCGLLAVTTRCVRDAGALRPGARAIVDGGPIGDRADDLIAAALFGDARAVDAIDALEFGPEPLREAWYALNSHRNGVCATERRAAIGVRR